VGEGADGFFKAFIFVGAKEEKGKGGGVFSGFFFKLKFYCLQKFCYIFVYFEGAGDAKGTSVLLEG